MEEELTTAILTCPAVSHNLELQDPPYKKEGGKALVLYGSL